MPIETRVVRQVLLKESRIARGVRKLERRASVKNAEIVTLLTKENSSEVSDDHKDQEEEAN